jgi:hypothetical protein
MMAFTETQRATIRRYLGWPALFRQISNSLEQAMSTISAFPETQVLIEQDLASCADMEIRIVDAYERLKAKSMGQGVELPGPDEIGMLRNEGRRYTAHIASTLGVEIYNDYWNSSLTVRTNGMTDIFGGGTGNQNMMRLG